MAEYKESLNLPNTAFPMKANLASREPEMLALWQEKKIYEQIRKLRSGSKKFILHDGPPYANGHLHCGHALNKIPKDIIIKSKSLSGYDAPFVPGWDCHGLPIELNVEKKIGKAGAKLSASEFRMKCRDYALSQIDIQRDEFQRLGILGDWYHPYITMDFKYEANIIRSLGKMIENGHLQQGLKPVHWCIDCGSALAEAEVDYEEKQSPSIDVAFGAVSPEAGMALFKISAPSKPLILPIWTTTPWTLPANEALCVHPELDYSLVDAGDRYFILASALVKSVMERYQIGLYKELAIIKGQELEHLRVKHPFYQKEVPVILGAHVSTESGTGLVHTAPSHGPDDYMVGQLYHLPLLSPVKTNGCFAEDVALFAGLSVLKANEPIMELLLSQGALLAKESIRHSYPHCWRHKSPMIFLATPQWFLSMGKAHLRQKILAAIDTVNWVPEWGKARIQNMVENRPDWCISRQRAWGTPLPLFLHQETGAPHPRTLELIEEVAVLVEQKGIEAWFGLDKESLLGVEAPLYDKVNDTLDVWLDSGVSHFCVLQQHPDLSYPADLYFEGSDQHRGWFNSSLTTSVAMDAGAPYKMVLTHGYTVDAEGKKLSKSKGNYVALDKMVNLFGADILRLWVASTDYRHEVSISDEIMKRTADAYRRIRNTARFLLANLFDFEVTKDSVPVAKMLELDRWALKRCQNLQEEIIQAYELYQFHLIYQKIHNFCAVDMGSFYLDVIKDRQYTCAKDSIARRSCQTAMYHIIKAFTLWIAPILSFTAEEIWQYIPGKAQQESVFLQSWYQDWPKVESINMADWAKLQLIRDEVNKALEESRQQAKIGSPLAADLKLYAEDKILAQLKRLGEELRFLLITSGAEVYPLSEKPAELKASETGLAVLVSASRYEKCERCWHRCEDVGQNPEHPALCLRCVGNISGQNEKRVFI